MSGSGGEIGKTYKLYFSTYAYRSAELKNQASKN